MFVIYTDCVSPHQVPFAREMAKRVGQENFRYVYRDQTQSDRVKTGWTMDGDEPWMVWMGERGEKGESGERGEKGENWRELVENAEVLYTGFRDVELFERRAKKGLTTLYYSERWFKPLALFDLRLFDCLISIHVPGWVRMLSPGYRRMAKRMVAWLKTDPNARYLAVGPWAKQDLLKLGVPDTKIIPWGYFVEPGCRTERPLHSPLRILYVGRLLTLKRVDTVIRAVAVVSKSRPVSLSIVGDGPERTRLERLAGTQFNQTIKQSKQSNNPQIAFLGSLPISTIRSVMRDHDILVFSSNALDGWGAVVSEALEEGMRVIGTRETGAAAAMLPESCLYSCGDWRELEKKLQVGLPYVGIGNWTAAGAAERLGLAGNLI